MFSLHPESYFVIHGILFSSHCLPNSSYFKHFPLCHVINCAVGHISLLQISLEPTDTVASLSICFKILLSLFQYKFSYLSVSLLFQYSNLGKEKEQLLMKKKIGRTKSFHILTLLETENLSRLNWSSFTYFLYRST